MKGLQVVGLILIVLGIISFTYQGINYTTHKKVVDIGPIQATTTEHKTIPLPPILGGLAFVGGIVLLVAGRKE
jgi:UDP-N-acetylmuramyl pentapeptide phosphotransferase/UDP-N-acetylglucosamine-1-phosphate transferase